MSVHAEDSAYALLSDGATIEIRAARPDDFDAVRDMHAKMSPDNLYLRFFSMSPMVAEQEARRICREPGPDHAALLAVLDGEVVGCGTYEQAGAGSGSAEVAFTVADDLQTAASACCCSSTWSRWPAAGVPRLYRGDAERERGHAAGIRRRRAAGAALPGGRRV